MKKMFEIISSRSLIIAGIIFSILGIALATFSKLYSRKTILESKSFSKLRILSKGYPTKFYFRTPDTVLLKIKFKERGGQNLAFRIIKEGRIDHTGAGIWTETFEVPCTNLKIARKSVSFKLPYDPIPNSKYVLLIESDVEGLSEEGIRKVANVFTKNQIPVKEEGNKLVVIAGGYIEIAKLVDMFQHVFLDKNLYGEKLKEALIEDAKNTGWDKHFLEWYSKNPSIFDELAKVIRSIMAKPSARVCELKYELIRVEKPYEWLFDVGLTLITIGVVVFLAGLK
jgi:hypothetical protein